MLIVCLKLLFNSSCDYSAIDIAAKALLCVFVYDHDFSPYKSVYFFEFPFDFSIGYLRSF